MHATMGCFPFIVFAFNFMAFTSTFMACMASMAFIAFVVARMATIFPILFARAFTFVVFMVFIDLRKTPSFAVVFASIVPVAFMFYIDQPAATIACVFIATWLVAKSSTKGAS